ncbi:GyrI-like domain-containing protein [Leifsonia lichenia]
MKADLKKEVTGYAATRGRFDIVTVPARRYLMVDGRGDPNTAPEYAAALAALYPLAYKLKFFSKNELGRDYGVMPLEGLWWADDLDAFTRARDKTQWQWTMLNLVPDWIADEHIAVARAAAPGSEAVRIGTLDEGLCVQTLHVGSYDDEAPILDALHTSFIPQNGLRMTGKHHEIYLSDARRTAPEKLRTILRQPVARIPS